MPLDPSLIAGIGQHQNQQNSLDSMGKMMSLQTLSLQNQALEKETQDKIAMSDIIKRNTVVDENGKPTLNRKSALSEMAKVDPMKMMAFQKDLQSHDVEYLKNQHEIAKQLVWSATPENWQQLKQKGAQMGLDVTGLPDQATADQIKEYQWKVLSIEDQTKKMESDRTFAQKDKELLYKHDENKLKAAENKLIKQGQTDRQTREDIFKVQQMAEQTRGSPAVAQAEKDLYAAKKFDSLFNLNGDPNNLNPQMVQLGATEIAKIASGGVPSIHELEGLNQNNIPKALASAAQIFTASPTPANQGELMKEYKKYSDALKSDAISTIEDKYGRVFNPHETEYGKNAAFQGMKDEYIGRFKKEKGESKSLVPAQQHQEAQTAAEWANQVLNDPKAPPVAKEKAAAIKQRLGQ